MEMKLDVRRRAEKQPDAIGAGPKMGDGTFAYRRYFAAPRCAWASSTAARITTSRTSSNAGTHGPVLQHHAVGGRRARPADQVSRSRHVPGHFQQRHPK
jgi:hypothetical protein